MTARDEFHALSSHRRYDGALLWARYITGKLSRAIAQLAALAEKVERN